MLLLTNHLGSDAFYDFLSDTQLIYFDKGTLRCALTSRYSDKGAVILPGLNDRSYTEISFTNECLENGVLYSIGEFSHFDGERVLVHLYPYPLVAETTSDRTNLIPEVTISTSDKVTFEKINSVSGLKILSCQN